jgi:hypothetical protein
MRHNMRHYIMAKRDVPSWMLLGDGSGRVYESGYQSMRGAVASTYAKLLDNVEIISVIFAPSERDMYCFRCGLAEAGRCRLTL